MRGRAARNLAAQNLDVPWRRNANTDAPRSAAKHRHLDAARGKEDSFSLSAVRMTVGRFVDHLGPVGWHPEFRLINNDDQLPQSLCGFLPDV
jgi:hypothetical protein